MYVKLSKKALDNMATTAYDPTFGARPLKRMIVEKIENPLARAIISGTLPKDGVYEVKE